MFSPLFGYIGLLQARVTKASVTIVFNNSDVKSSPVGYEQFKEITVTRQVLVYSWFILIFLIYF
jgi:hypothetical protein